MPGLLVGERLDRLAGGGPFDVVAEIAVPLSVAVVADLLGVEPPPYGEFAAVSDAIMRSMDGGLNPALVEPSRVARQRLSDRVRGEAFLLLAGLLLIFPSRADRRFENSANIKKKHRTIDGYRTEYVETSVTGPARAWGNRSCTCATPQLVAKIQNAEYPAEPSDQMGPAATLFRAQCRVCGGKYDKPWSRTSSTPINQTSRPET